jgi:hypothetical protein
MLFQRTPLGLSCLLLLMGIWLNSCSVEKRLYRPGWNIEWSQRKTAVDNEMVTEMSTGKENRMGHDLLRQNPIDTPNVHSVIISRELKCVVPENDNIAARVDEDLKKDLVNHSVNGREVSAAKRMHPKAGLSLLMGSISVGSLLVPIFVSGLGLTVLVLLAILLIISALLAQKWSKIALEDMYMARNRYSGKALAAAGMILSILALVGLVGVIVIGLLGLAFLSVA